jgi:hypothetical protein
LIASSRWRDLSSPSASETGADGRELFAALVEIGALLFQPADDSLEGFDGLRVNSRHNASPFR